MHRSILVKKSCDRCREKELRESKILYNLDLQQQLGMIMELINRCKDHQMETVNLIQIQLISNYKLKSV